MNGARQKENIEMLKRVNDMVTEAINTHSIIRHEESINILVMLDISKSLAVIADALKEKK